MDQLLPKKTDSQERVGGTIQSHNKAHAKVPGTWPISGRQQPSQFHTHFNNENSYPPILRRLAIPWLDDKALVTPKTPSTPIECGLDGLAQCIVVDDSDSMCSPTATHVHSAILEKATTFSGELPEKHTQRPRLSLKPAELAGSLLLPSQGFKPPPYTPPRPVTLSRSGSEESNGDLLSSPTDSALSTDHGSMEALKFLSASAGKRVRSQDATPSAKTYGVQESSHVTKPFSAMTLDELLQVLPECSPTVINHMWIPEMQKKCNMIKATMNDLSGINLETSEEQRKFGSELKAFSEEARKISNTYMKAIESAESLLERDTTKFQDKLRQQEMKIQNMHVENEAVRHDLGEKDEMIAGLESTLQSVVRVLESFVQNNLDQCMSSLPHSEIDEIVEVIAKFGDDKAEQADVRLIRVPESTYVASRAALRDAKQKIVDYQELLHEQNDMIQEQSKQLDQQVNKYEAAVKKIQERDHEILLLSNHIEDMDKKIDDYETTLQFKEASSLAQEKVTENYAEMDKTLKSLRVSHAQQLEEKDMELAVLRSKLGSAREEILARKADVKNIISQAHARLQPLEQQEVQSKGLTSKARKFLGKEKELSRRVHLPRSESQQSVTLHRLKMDLMSSPDPKFSSKEVASSKGRLSYHQTTSSPMLSTPVQRRRASDPFMDTRSQDDLGKPAKHERVLGTPEPPTASPTATSQKQLPIPPNIMAQISPSASPTTQRNETLIDHLDDKATTGVAKAFDMRGLRSPHRRVLTLIPESENEDVSSNRTPSTDSSDREVFRKSVHDFDRLYRSKAVSNHDGPADEGRVWLSRSDDAKDSVSVKSAEMTVSEMYHRGRGHIGGN